MKDLSIGQRLQSCRGSIPIKRVAADNEISESAIRMYENDQRVPRDAIKVKLAYYYHKSVEDLFF